MHHKDIKRIVKEQLKSNFPNWRSLNRKKKKKIAREIVEKVSNAYDFSQQLSIPVEELTGIEDQVPTAGVMSLDEMARFVDNIQRSNLFDLKTKRAFSNIKDEELKFINDLLDDHIINCLLSYEGYSPCMREVYPSNFFRAELLKAIKYPEISYRKFCQEEYMGLDRKQNREFMGLPLHKKIMIHHTQLSQFRASMAFPQMTNLLVYVLSHFFQSGMLSQGVLHGVDSTELPNDNMRPLCSLNVNGQKIRIYTDIDADCGKRRNKRDKSSFFIGYRMHTLTVIDAQTGHSFPLVSLLAAGNHHDSLFLKPLIKLALAMGIEVKLITADEAYHDKDGSLFDEMISFLKSKKIVAYKLPERLEIVARLPVVGDQKINKKLLRQQIAEKLEILIKNEELRIKTCLRHLELAIKVKGERRAVIEHRKFYSGYLKGLYNASKTRNELMKFVDYAGVEDLLLKYLSELKEIQVTV